MKKLVILTTIILFYFNAFSQFSNFKEEFENAYSEHKNIPKGLLEAISYSKTHFQNLDNKLQGCSDLPIYYGPMAIVKDGKKYFIKGVSLKFS